MSSARPDQAGPVRIVAATSACLDPAQARELGVTLVPLRVGIGDRNLRDVEEISPQEVVQLVRRGEVLRTSSPPPGDYLAAFEAISGPVLCLSEASSMSAINSSAGVAAQMIGDGRVEVVDTGTAAGGMRLLTLEAARLARAGVGLEELRHRIAGLAARVEVVGMLETVEFLVRSGRIPEIAHWGASLLRVRPVVRFQPPSGSLAALARSPIKGVRELHNLAVRDVKKQNGDSSGEHVHSSVFHADAPELADELLGRLRHDLPHAELSASEVTAAMIVHVGPGLVGYGLYVDPEDLAEAD
ncbi:MAG: DegV family protein [Candidatus Dormibacteraeota bacterium]|nr:DegV family protein [Candidatus Dormibacteraeota bacterium]